MTNITLKGEVRAKIESHQTFGFIFTGEGETEQAHFVHINVVEACGLNRLTFKGKVEFQSVPTNKDPRVTVISKVGGKNTTIDEVALAAANEPPKKKGKPTKQKTKPPQSESPEQASRKRGPKIKGRRPVQIELKKGDQILGRFTKLDWSRGISFVRVSGVSSEDGFRPREDHERISDVFVLARDIPEGDAIDDAIENDDEFVFEIEREASGKKRPMGKLVRVFLGNNVADIGDAAAKKSAA